MRKYTKEAYEQVMTLRKEKGYGHNRISEITGLKPRTIRGWIYDGRKPYDAWTTEDYLKHAENKRVSKIGSLNPAWKGDKAKPSAGCSFQLF